MFFRTYDTAQGSQLKKIQDLLNNGLETYKVHYDIGGHFLESDREQTQEHTDIMREFLLGNIDGSQLKRAILAITIDTSAQSFQCLAADLRNEYHLQSFNIDNDFYTLKKNWLNQAKYAHFTVDALFVSDKLLTELGTWIKQAKKKTKKYPAHERYLMDMEAWIVEERQLIARTLFYRLNISYQHLSSSKHQPIPYILKKLEQHQVFYFNKYHDLSELQRSEGEFPFVKALEYISAHGSAVLKRMIQSYMVIKTFQGNVAVELIHQGQNSYLVPETLKEFIPLRRPFWTRIIPGYKDRYQFMHNKTELLIEMMSLEKSSFSPEFYSDLNHPYWQRLSKLQTAFKEELKQSEQQKSKWFSFLFKTTNNMLSVWSNLMTEQQRKVTKLQIGFLHSYAKNLSFVSDLDDGNEHSAANENHNIQAQLDEVEKMINKLPSLKGERRQFLNIKSEIARKLGFDKNAPTSQRQSGLSSMLHDFVDNNKPLTELFWSDFAYLQANDIREFEQFVDLNRVYFSTISKNVIYQMSALPQLILNKQDILGITEYLLEASKLLRQVLPCIKNRSELVAGLKQELIASFTEYPDYIRQLTPKDVEERKFTFELIHQALLGIVSLDKSMEQEKRFFIKAELYLRDILDGRKPTSMTEILSQTRKLIQESKASSQTIDIEREQRTRHLNFLSNQTRVPTEDSSVSGNEENISSNRI